MFCSETGLKQDPPILGVALRGAVRFRYMIRFDLRVPYNFHILYSPKAESYACMI